MAISNGQTASAADILGLVSFQTAATTTLSLTTIASEKVLVFAKGTATGGTNQTVNLKYNGSVQDSVQMQNQGSNVTVPFALMYTATPGAATQNVTVDGATIASCVIMVIHLKQS